MDQANRDFGITSASLSVVAESVSQGVEIRRCCRRGCTAPALDDAERCGPHERKQRQYNAAYMSRRRAAWKRAKRCPGCGAAKLRPGFKRCSACVTKARKRLPESVKRSVENKKAERIAARMIAWVNSPTNEGRERMRGGERGRPSIEAENQLDVDQIREDLAVAVDALADAGAEYQKLVPPIQRDNTRRAAAARFLLVAKWALSIAKRNAGRAGVRAAEILAEQMGSADDEEET